MSQDRAYELQALLCRLGLSFDKLEKKDWVILSTALTHTSAGLEGNHEDLEFLGDAVLRLACAEFLDDHNLHLSVGDRSAFRAQLVSDRWLAELAAEVELDGLILQGAATAGDTAAKGTVRAECCEALVGAVYLAWGAADGGLRAVRQWLDPYWQRSCLELSEDPYRHNWKSALQELTQAQKAGLPVYATSEQNRSHGDPKRFHSVVTIKNQLQGSGWGSSRRLAEQEAARAALEQIKPSSMS